MFMDEQRKWHEIYMKHREEDMKFRETEIRQRDLTNRRREMDEKNEQLRNISSVSALIAGFSIVVLVQMNINLDIPEWILTLLATSCAITVCLMTYAYVTCTLILVGTLKKFEVNYNFEEEERLLNISNSFHRMTSQEIVQQRSNLLKTRFILFWESTCEADWSRAYTAFSLGVPSFLFNMIMVGWVKFLPLLWPGSVVTVICGSTIIFLFWTSHMKWGTFLAQSANSRKNELKTESDSLRRQQQELVPEASIQEVNHDANDNNDNNNNSVITISNRTTQ